MNTLSPINYLTRRILPTLSHPWIYLLAGSGVLLLDYLTPSFIMFPILFVIPVIFSAWFYTKRASYLLAVLLPISRFILAYSVDSTDPVCFLAINAIIRIAVLCTLTFLVARTARQAKELEKRVNQLEGILPICMFCKRIRDEHQNWQRIESYITEHSSAQFSHGLCADCQKKHYAEFV
ncbi:MAG: hypothetical protein WCP12_08410 [bacterium]